MPRALAAPSGRFAGAGAGRAMRPRKPGCHQKCAGDPVLSLRAVLQASPVVVAGNYEALPAYLPVPAALPGDGVSAPDTDPYEASDSWACPVG